MKPIRIGIWILILLSALLPVASGQSVTGQISGTVTDPAGAVIVGASVQLTHDLSKQVRTFQTQGAGTFVFTGLVPGTYSIRVTVPGFKTYEQKRIIVATQERVDLHDLRLEVGDVSTSVEVSAQSVHVATDSSDRSTNVTLIQLQDTPIRGRDFLGAIKSLPGVVDTGKHDSRGWGTAMPTINGGKMGQTLLNIDGIAAQDSGNLDPGYMAPSPDAISEVRLAVSNFSAEYGGRSGGQMLVSIKSGNNQFHGTGYYYWRHEQLNANEWFNNAQRVAKPRYRFQNPGGTIGGPLLIPGTNFNKSRTKLFFFFSADLMRNKQAVNNKYTMPTVLERQGDFSQTVQTNGNQVPVYDPTTGAQFPGNIIPASRISPFGLAFMNKFPLPSAQGYAIDPSGTRQYNSVFVLPQDRPQDDKILRVDYNIGQKTTAYVRLLQDYQSQDGYAGTVHPAGGGWGQFPASYHVQAAGAVATVVHTFSPNLINEFTWGVNRGKQGVNAIDEAKYQNSLLPLKDSNGNTLTLPSIYKANSQNLLPTISFGLPSGFSAQSSGLGIANAPTFGHDSRWPFVGTDTVQSITDKVTWVKGSHNFKAGFYYERMARNVAVYETYYPQGTYYFGSDRASAVDTGYPYSNLLTGAFYAYGEDNKRQINHARYNQVEWFLQDSWKVSRRLTVEYGARFYVVGPLKSVGANLGLFQGSAYSANKNGQLLYPTMVDGQKASINPQTGATYKYARQGTFDNASYSGDNPFTGIVSYKDSFFNTPPVQVGPRIGFAWDVFGNGKTALRGGFGIVYGRPWNVDDIGAIGSGNGPLAAPNNLRSSLILNNTFGGLAGSEQIYTPQNALTGSPDYPVPATYNWSLSLQRDLGRGMILDVGYVGNVSHHIANSSSINSNTFATDVNAVAPLTTWTPSGGANPKYLDPTSSKGGTGAFYSTNLIRAMTGYAGYGSIYAYTFVGEAYYEALQTSLNKRFSKGLQFGANYTWSKTLTYSRQRWVDDLLTKDVTGRPHAVNFNFGYDIPAARLWNSAIGKQVLGGWRINGNGTAYYGTSMTIGCGAQSQPIGYWTGTPTGGIPFRCQMNGDMWLPSGQYPSTTADQRLQFPFNKASFSLPGANTLGIGNTPPTMTYGPGIFNVDLAISKELTLWKEGYVLELRGEAFNFFNHLNPSNPSTTLTLNYNTGVNSNAAFGTITGAQIDSRHMVLSARFRF